jgi:alginate O-acetyltransferase complex protein AlgI
VSKWKWYRNLLIVFLVSGLWHGANWTFIVWGALHGFYTIFGLLTKERRQGIAEATGITRLPRLYKFINQVIVFMLVTFAWIFFRAENFHKAKQVIHKLFEFNFSHNLTQLSAGRGPLNLALTFVAIGLLWLSYLLPANMKLKHSLLFLVVTTFIIIILGKNAGAEFIYFQF